MSKEVSIGEAIQQFLSKSRLQGAIRSLQIEDVWEEVMGKTIARYTDKIQVINQTLFVTTSVAPLKQELLFQRNKIMQRINEAMGEQVVKDVVIQ
jgi:predicted nucleic acid-binding Zn ribbon protein